MGDDTSSDIALDSIQDIFFLVELPDGGLRRWNRALGDATGYTDDELAEMTLFDFFDEGEPGRHSGFIDTLREQDRGSTEAMLVSKDGRRTHYEFTATALRDAGTGKVKGLVGTGRDLTERIEYEDALRESEARFKAIADSSFTGIAIHDGTALVYMNDRMTEITGYPKEHFTGAGEFFELLRAEDSAMLSGQIWDFLKGKQLNIPPVVTLNRKDGRVAEVVANVKLVALDGEPVVLLSVFDITEQRRLERRLRDQTAELSKLLAVAAHELRHPATVFKGYAVLLRDVMEGQDRELIREALDGTERAADRLTELVDKLLYASDTERGGVRLALVDVDPGTLVERAISLVRSMGATNEFRVNLPEGRLAVRADADTLVRALGEILENAVKFSEPGSRVDVTVERGSGETIFHVRDRGSGIPDGQYEMIFERFYQSEDMLHHSKPGIGLGLSLAKAVVEAHGGWIGAEAAEGGGTLMSFGIPARKEDGWLAAVPLKALVVDDDPEIVKLIGVQLRQRGHTPLNAYGGREAIDKARSELPDVVVLDLMMPEVDGFQVIEKLKGSKDTRDIPIVVVTARSEIAVRNRAIGLGASGVLVKPFAMDDLIRAVEEPG